MALALIALAMAGGCGGHANAPSLTVGSGRDSESALVAQLYAAALRYYGTDTRVDVTADPVAGLDGAGIQVTPGLTGQLLQRFEPDAAARADEQVYREMNAALQEGVAAGDYTSSTQDKPAVGVSEATATAWHARDMSALLRHCADVAPGAVAGAKTPSMVGGCWLRTPRVFSDDAALFAALRAGQVNAVWTTTAAPDIPSDVVVLADRTALIRAENLVPLYRRNELNQLQLRAVNELAGVLDTAALADMRRQVAGGADPAAVADAFLAANPLGH